MPSRIHAGLASRASIHAAARVISLQNADQFSPRRALPSRKAHPMRIPAFVPILFTSNYSDSDPFRSENNLAPDIYSQNPPAAAWISGTFPIEPTFSAYPRTSLHPHPALRSCRSQISQMKFVPEIVTLGSTSLTDVYHPN